ncbi:MAG TPA: hypothetical protein VGG21_00620 [Acidimicrobiales bacterium]|jgi:hypothetical protein
MIDDDLENLSPAELVAEVRALRGAIRQHRDSSGHDLCWFHPALWSVLPEVTASSIAVPPWPQFMRGCVAYRASLDAQAPQAPADPREFGG